MKIVNDKLFPLRRKDLNKAVTIMVNAFMNYPIPGGLIKNDYRRRIGLREMFKIMLKRAYKKDQIFTLGGDFKEVSVWTETTRIPPNREYLSCISLSTIRLFSAINGRESKNLALAFKEIENVKRELILPEKTAELFVLAVDPDSQKQGRAGKMVTSALEELNSRGYSCLVITNTEHNRLLYEKLGFQLIKQTYDNRNKIDTYFLLNNPYKL